MSVSARHSSTSTPPRHGIMRWLRRVLLSGLGLILLLLVAFGALQTPPAKRALADACDMWAEIGRDRIEDYVLSLSAYCKELLRDAFGGSLAMYSPDVPELSSGITAVNPFADRSDLATLNLFRDRLRDEYGFIVRTTDFRVTLDGPEEHALRISTHLFHNERDVEGLVAAMSGLFEQMS